VYTIQKERFPNIKISAIDKCEIIEDTENGFIAEIEFDGGILRMFSVLVLSRTYPQRIKEVINKLDISKQNLFCYYCTLYIGFISSIM
jgi:hypothetical protein